MFGMLGVNHHRRDASGLQFSTVLFFEGREQVELFGKSTSVASFHLVELVLPGHFSCLGDCLLSLLSR